MANGIVDSSGDLVTVPRHHCSRGRQRRAVDSFTARAMYAAPQFEEIKLANAKEKPARNLFQHLQIRQNVAFKAAIRCGFDLGQSAVGRLTKM